MTNDAGIQGTPCSAHLRTKLPFTILLPLPSESLRRGVEAADLPWSDQPLWPHRDPEGFYQQLAESPPALPHHDPARYPSRTASRNTPFKRLLPYPSQLPQPACSPASGPQQWLDAQTLIYEKTNM